MRNRLLLVALLLLARAAVAQEDPGTDWSPLCWSSCWRAPSDFEKWTLGVTLGLELIDGLMTNDFKHRPSEYGSDENPVAEWMLGRHPSTARTLGVTAAGMALTTALWYALPPFWRCEVTLTVGGFEAYNVANMYSVGIRFRL